MERKGDSATYVMIDNHLKNDSIKRELFRKDLNHNLESARSELLHRSEIDRKDLLNLLEGSERDRKEFRADILQMIDYKVVPEMRRIAAQVEKNQVEIRKNKTLIRRAIVLGVIYAIYFIFKVPPKELFFLIKPLLGMF